MTDIAIHAQLLEMEPNPVVNFFEGFATNRGHVEPFALSYRLVCRSSDILVRPSLKYWSKFDDLVHRSKLSQRSTIPPLEARRAFSFLEWDDLRLKAEAHLQDVIPEGHNESFHLALTAYGAVLVAEYWYAIQERHGESAVAAAFLLGGMSNHKKLAATSWIATVIRNMLLHGEQQRRPAREVPTFSVTMA
jgi:hypothetical protein